MTIDNDYRKNNLQSTYLIFRAYIIIIIVTRALVKIKLVHHIQYISN